MSITVVCPNGHALQVKDVYAGRSGFCPHCRAVIQVPQLPARPQLSEEAILGFLGVGEPRGRAPALAAVARASRVAEAPVPPKKSCSKCHREVLGGTHICPFCHTYIVAPSDF